MAWANEAALPFTPDGRIYFSPNEDGVTYIIDQGNTNFYKYNTTTNVYTQLTAPTYHVNVAGSFIRPLALSPDGTKLACISDGVANHRGGRRIEIYSISGNSWTASSQVQDMTDEEPRSIGTVLSGLVWADENTIWVWASEATTGVKNYARCIKYTISADIFSVWTTLVNGGLSYAQAYSAAINSAGTVIYGSVIGASTRGWYKYTIATDTYAAGTTLTSGRIFAVATDSDKLWYVTTADYRPGYLDVADDSENDNQFEENTDRDTGYGLYISVKDNLSFVVAHARAASPELMSVGYAITYPTPDPGEGVDDLAGLTRVTGLIHRYDRRQGVYQLECSFGDTTSVVQLPYTGSPVRATADKQKEEALKELDPEIAQKVRDYVPPAWIKKEQPATKPLPRTVPFYSTPRVYEPPPKPVWQPPTPAKIAAYEPPPWIKSEESDIERAKRLAAAALKKKLDEIAYGRR